MKSLSAFPRILIFPAHIDFRKGRRSLAAFAQSSLNENPFDCTLYLFINRRKDCLKALYWAKSGFALWEMGLEEAKFPWPKPPYSQKFEITAAQAEWLLEGIDIWKMRPHKELKYNFVV